MKGKQSAARFPKTLTLSRIEAEVLLEAVYSIQAKDMPEGSKLRALIRVEKKLLELRIDPL